MAILEIGINLGMKRLVEIKYYSSSDNILDSNIRAKFLSGIEDFISEVFGDEINVISLSSFEIICYQEIVQKPDKEFNNPQPLLIFSIIEKGTSHTFVEQHLREIISCFLKKYDLDDILTRSPKFFKNFESDIDKILGDLRFSTEDRIRTVFRDRTYQF
ncbi:MAG: hypothetical protein ACFFBC_12880 [Promethearchaeota archaeon]